MGNDDVFKALADVNRREIVEMLRKQSLTVGEIVAKFDISQPSISEHLRILKQADIVYPERRGRYITYHLNTTVFQDILSFFIALTGRK